MTQVKEVQTGDINNALTSLTGYTKIPTMFPNLRARESVLYDTRAVFACS